MVAYTDPHVNIPGHNVDEIKRHVNGAPLDIRSTAHTCLDLGLSVVPIKADGSKKPACFWKWLQYERLYEGNIARAFFPGSGVALIGGAVSGNLEFLDFDSWDVWLAFETLARASGYRGLLDRMKSGYFERSPNGAHLPFRCEVIAGNQPLAQRPAPTPDNPTAVKAIIETRGEGGFCIIAPSNGRVHDTGKPYVLESGSLATIPTITPEERNDLFTLARTLNEIVKPTPEERPPPHPTSPTGDRPGDLFNARATWDEILAPHGWIPVCEQLGITYWRRPGKQKGVSATTNFHGSDILYVFSTSTAFEAERGYKKFSAFTLLNHNKDFSAAAAALSHAGYTQQHPPGATPPPATDWQGQYTPKSTGLALTSLSDLLNEPEEKVSWLAEGMLPSAGFSLVVAKPKVGKSTLARNLALAVATGHDFLGKNTQKGPVIYLALEEKRAEVRKHFLDMGAKGEEEIYIFAASAPEDALLQLRAAIANIHPVLVVIDPLFRLTRVRDGNDYAQVTAAMEPLLAMARETGAHVSCMHHLGKGGDREGGDAILGSTAIFASVDTALIMKRSERYRTVSSIQRYGEDLAETVLLFDPTTRTVSLGESKDQEEEKRIAEAIIEFLKNTNQTPVEEAEITEKVEGRKTVKVSALRRLLKEAKVYRQKKFPEKTGNRGNPYLYALERYWFPVSGCKYGNEGTSIEIGGVSTRKHYSDTGSQILPKEEDSREPVSASEDSREPVLASRDTGFTGSQLLCEDTGSRGSQKTPFSPFEDDARKDASPPRPHPTWREEEL